MLKRVGLCVAVLLAFAVPSWGQHVHPQSETKVIYGKDNPELIKDLDAYREVFFVLSEANGLTARQHMLLAGTGMSDANVLAAATILNDFRARFDQLVGGYNSSEDVKAGSAAAQRLFYVKLNLLVQFTRDALKASLTQEGMKTFDKWVQGEKSKMGYIGEVIDQ